jgi:hypothetical protein
MLRIKHSDLCSAHSLQINHLHTYYSNDFERMSIGENWRISDMRGSGLIRYLFYALMLLFFEASCSNQTVATLPQVSDERVYWIAEDTFLFGMIVGHKVVNDSEVLAQVRRTGFAKSCPIIYTHIQKLERSHQNEFQKILVATMRRVVPSEKLRDQEAWGLFSGPIHPYFDRIRTDVANTDNDLLSMVSLSARNRIVADLKKLPDQSFTSKSSYPIENLKVGYQLSVACTGEISSIPGANRSARSRPKI